MDNARRMTILQDMTTDLIIVGGGLNGLPLALAAAQAGLSVALIDSLAIDTRADPAFDGRSYAMSLSSKRLLDAIGLWPALAADAQPMLQIKVSDGRAGEGAAPWVMEFDHREIEDGPMGFMVEDRHLRAAALDAVANHPRITHLAGQTVVAQTDDGEVALSSGKTLQGRVVIGCDGRKSGTATRAGIARTGWDYGQTAVVACVAHEAAHDGTAHQFFMPAGPLAILPLTGNRSSIVWSEATARAQALSRMDDPAFLEALRPVFGSFLGQISLTGQRFTYPLSLSLAHRFIAPRVALVGDAAHGIHPIAGQGLNAGLRDVAALVQVLTEAHRRGEDIGSQLVLERYQTWRRPAAVKLALATDGFNRLFSNDNPILRAARDLGMGAVNAWPGLRRTFIREAAGLTGPVPELMRG